jgi:hypothetical protein
MISKKMTDNQKGDKMKRIVEFPMNNTEEVMFVEIEDDEKGELTEASLLGDSIERASETLENSLKKIKPAAEAVIKNLKHLSVPPVEISVAFGLKLSADVGMIIAASGIEANYTVTVVWRKDETRTAARRVAKKSK